MSKKNVAFAWLSGVLLLAFTGNQRTTRLLNFLGYLAASRLVVALVVEVLVSGCCCTGIFLGGSSNERRAFS